MRRYVVTGAAGFIGSKLVEALNRRGVDEIIAVDSREHAGRAGNLGALRIAEFIDKGDFLARLSAGGLNQAVTAVLHQGANSDTTETDEVAIMQNNFEYSRALLDWCQARKVPLLYASSAAIYGAGREFREDPACEAPLNLYGRSKHRFDQYVRGRLETGTAQIAGLRYFNVYGPNESHKKKIGPGMNSVALQAFEQFTSAGKVRLFVGSGGYGNGEQRRDFIHVDDTVKVNLWLLENPAVSGIFNCGTGRAQSFNDVAAAVINSVRGSRLPVAKLVEQKLIEYIPFPRQLMGKYQSYTQADLSRLRAAGYTGEFMTVEQGVAAYVKELQKK